MYFELICSISSSYKPEPQTKTALILKQKNNIIYANQSSKFVLHSPWHTFFCLQLRIDKTEFNYHFKQDFWQRRYSIRSTASKRTFQLDKFTIQNVLLFQH